MRWKNKLKWRNGWKGRRKGIWRIEEGIEDKERKGVLLGGGAGWRDIWARGAYL